MTDIEKYKQARQEIFIYFNQPTSVNEIHRANLKHNITCNKVMAVPTLVNDLKSIFGTDKKASLYVKVRMVTTDYELWGMIEKLFDRVQRGELKDCKVGAAYVKYLEAEAKRQKKKRRSIKCSGKKAAVVHKVPDLHPGQYETLVWGMALTDKKRRELTMKMANGLYGVDDVKTETKRVSHTTNGLQWITMIAGRPNIEEVNLSRVFRMHI